MDSDDQEMSFDDSNQWQNSMNNKNRKANDEMLDKFLLDNDNEGDDVDEDAVDEHSQQKQLRVDQANNFNFEESNGLDPSQEESPNNGQEDDAFVR